MVCTTRRKEKLVKSYCRINSSLKRAKWEWQAFMAFFLDNGLYNYHTYIFFLFLNHQMNLPLYLFSNHTPPSPPRYVHIFWISVNKRDNEKFNKSLQMNQPAAEATRKKKDSLNIQKGPLLFTRFLITNWWMAFMEWFNNDSHSPPSLSYILSTNYRSIRWLSRKKWNEMVGSENKKLLYQLLHLINCHQYPCT